MSVSRPSLGKYIYGMVASLVIFLAGGWLILAPFALGYQPGGADWVGQTTNNFIVGICVAVVALIAFALFFLSLLGSLRAAGVMAARSRAQATVIPAETPPHVVAAPAAASNQSDLDRTLATLAQALAADLNSRRQTSGDLPANSLTEQYNTNRRDA